VYEGWRRYTLNCLREADKIIPNQRPKDDRRQFASMMYDDLPRFEKEKNEKIVESVYTRLRKTKSLI
jgi:hypothetical protein